jgi:hypothetical protein
MNLVKNVLRIEPYKLTIEFKSGEIRVVDMEKKILSKSTTPKSKYRALLDYDYFKKVKIQEEWETIYWDNGLDFCPDVLYKIGIPIKADILNEEKIA